MASSPPPPPRQKRQPQQVTEWPATSDEMQIVRQEMARLASEQQEFRTGLVGSKDFPGGKLREIQDSITAAETHRAEDVKQLHGRLTGLEATIAQQPDVFAAKINGTYVKTADLIPKVDARIKEKRGEGRLAMMSNAGRWWWTVFSLIAAGLITYLVTNVVPHATTVTK